MPTVTQITVTPLDMDGACCPARLLAAATMSAGGTSDGCNPEENRAGQRAPSMSSWVTVICVAVGISHHPVLRVVRVGLRGGGSPVTAAAGSPGCGRRA